MNNLMTIFFILSGIFWPIVFVAVMNLSGRDAKPKPREVPRRREEYDHTIEVRRDAPELKVEPPRFVVAPANDQSPRRKSRLGGNDRPAVRAAHGGRSRRD